MKILFGGFNARVERKRILSNRQLEMSLLPANNDSDVRIVNFATQKNSGC